MYQLNTSQGLVFYNALKTTVFQISKYG